MELKVNLIKQKDSTYIAQLPDGTKFNSFEGEKLRDFKARVSIAVDTEYMLRARFSRPSTSPAKDKPKQQAKRPTGRPKTAEKLNPAGKPKIAKKTKRKYKKNRNINKGKTRKTWQQHIDELEDAKLKRVAKKAAKNVGRIISYSTVRGNNYTGEVRQIWVGPKNKIYYRIYVRRPTSGDMHAAHTQITNKTITFKDEG